MANYKSQIRKIDRQIKKIERTIKQLYKDIENLQNEIVKLQGELQEIQGTYRELGVMMKIEYRNVEVGVNEINKKMDRSFKILTNAVNYRYDKNKDLKKEIKEEMNNLIKYINTRFSNTDKIRRIKVNIKNSEERIIKIQQDIPLKQNEMNVKMGKINELNMQSQGLMQTKQQLEEQIQVEMMQRQQAMMQKEQLGGRKKRVRRHKGINQQTGRLKKGYRYSKRKLKSGLLQIIKIKK